MEKILVPYDFSDYAHLAFEKAAQMASKLNSKIILLTVIGPDINTSGMSLSRAEELVDKEKAKSKEVLKKIIESKEYADLDISYEIVHTSSSIEGIITFAGKNDVDLIVMGSHGRKGFRKLVLGSVASGVITKSNCPVMIVKQKREK